MIHIKLPFIQRVRNKLINSLLNNVISNNILILIKKDGLIKTWKNNWENAKFDKSKSLQENVGCSNLPEILKYVDLTHSLFKNFIRENVPEKARVLDIGCGTGLYLNDFSDNYNLTGIDINMSYIDAAITLVPKAKYLCGSFLTTNVPNQYELIYSFSVFMYFERSSLPPFFDKIYRLLSDDGLFYLHYPHSVRFWDLLYPDLSYIKYSPNLLEKMVSERFEIVIHKHFFDERTVNYFDRIPYFFPDGNNTRLDTIRNSYLLVLKKKRKPENTA
jgi:SAM-dependent methyltransferase